MADSTVSMADVHVAAMLNLARHVPEPPRASGIRSALGRDVWLKGHIELGDEVLVDFDVHAVGDDGLYALELIEHGRVRWKGCRRFGTAADGSRVVFEFDGTPRPSACMPRGFRVAGKVVQVIPRQVAV